MKYLVTWKAKRLDDGWGQYYWAKESREFDTLVYAQAACRDLAKQKGHVHGTKLFELKELDF